MHDPRQEFTADEWHDWERALRDAEDELPGAKDWEVHERAKEIYRESRRDRGRWS